MTDNETSLQRVGSLVGVSRDPLVDGRQSARALEIQRGVCRMLFELGLSPFTEFTLANGRRADVAALSEKGDIWIVEIKSSLVDYNSDSKWPEYFDYSDRFLFAVDADFPLDVLPSNTGYMIADRYGAEIVREGAEDRLSAARRKAVTNRFACQAARRLHRIMDPDMSM